MKKLFLLFFLLAAIQYTTYAQSPEMMSYQAVIRNSSGGLVANQTVGMQFSILSGSITGSAVYVETQTAMTNQNGLVSLEIGSGTVVSGSFSAIDWSTGLYFIKVETDPSGGTSYTISGTTQLLSVPYAFYADIADSVLNETDPSFAGSPAAGITSGDISNWNANDSINLSTVLSNGNDGNGNAIENVSKISVGSAAVNSSASLEINTTDGAFLLPRLTTAQRDLLTPVVGMMIYNTDSSKFQGYTMTSGSGGSTTMQSDFSSISGSTCISDGPLAFTPSVSGNLTQIQFYVADPDTAALKVTLDYCGAQTFLGYSDTIIVDSGYHTWTFVTPIPVSAGTTYYVSSDNSRNCLGVYWASGVDNAQIGSVDNLFICTDQTLDPACVITITGTATLVGNWVDLH